MGMISRISGITKWAWYLWLLTLYPIMYLYSENLGDIREDDVVEVVIVALVITTVVYGLLYLFTREPYKSGAVTGVMALVFLTYGHIYNALGNNDLAQALLMPVMLALGFIAIFLILKSKTTWRQLAPYLNLIFAVLVTMVLWPVVDFHFINPPSNATALANPLERVVSTEKAMNSPERPDIYYIILDGYSSNEFWLREYGSDNSDFTDALEERGFFVAYESKSNYPATLVSLSSSLNMRYLVDDDLEKPEQADLHLFTYLRSLIANNRVSYELQQLGYTYINILSGFFSPGVMADTNVAFFPDGPRYFGGHEFEVGDTGFNSTWAYKQPFWSFFIETTILRDSSAHFDIQGEQEPYPIYSAQIFHGTFEEFQRIAKMEEATFTFVDITKPHFPLQFDRQGNDIDIHLPNDDPLKQQYFFEQLEYVNERVLGLVDFLVAESDFPPIIILQGDHSSDLGENVNSTCLYGFEILNAMYLPGVDTGDLDSALSPVNSFRLIFNLYFDQNYELLENKHYTQPRACEHNDPTFVQVTDDRRLNVDLGDHVALIYNGEDTGGDGEVQVYAVSESGEKGHLLFTITHDDVAGYLDKPPQQNTLITQQGLVAFYALTTGEFQFNIGPDADGREWAVVIDTFPARVVYGYEVGVD